MDESIQKQIEAALPKLAQAEHWTWFYGPGEYRYEGKCRWCEGRFPQSRETCLENHQTPTAGRLVRVI